MSRASRAHALQRSGLRRRLRFETLAKARQARRTSKVSRDSDHHARNKFGQGWRRQGVPEQTLADSYAVFTALRERGIRAHSWV